MGGRESSGRQQQMWKNGHWPAVGSVPSEPNKRDVKGHSSPAGAGASKGPGAEL